MYYDIEFNEHYMTQRLGIFDVYFTILYSLEAIFN